MVQSKKHGDADTPRGIDLTADPYCPLALLGDPAAIENCQSLGYSSLHRCASEGRRQTSWDDDGPPPPSALPLILLEATQVAVPVCEAGGWSIGFPIMPPPPPPPLPPPPPRCGRFVILGFALLGLVATAATATVLAIVIKLFVTGPALTSTTSPTTPFSSDISPLSLLVPSTAPSACLKVTTGKAANNDGMIQIYVNYGNGFVLVNTESLAYVSYNYGQIVVNQCWGTIERVQVSNPNDNAWNGTIEISLDFGKTYHPLVCSDLCTGTTRDTMSIVVDGGADSGDQATTQGFNSNKCTLRQQ